MGFLIGLLARFLPSLLTALGAGVWRTFFIGSFLAGVGIIIHNVALHYMSDFLSWIWTQVSNTPTPQGLTTRASVTGVTAAVCLWLRVPDCVSILVGCLSVKLILRCIPFIRLGG